MSVEVFKTNVKSREEADRLLCEIHLSFNDYRASFDLEDCDRILRVTCRKEVIDHLALIHFLRELKCIAEVLPDFPVTEMTRQSEAFAND